MQQNDCDSANGVLDELMNYMESTHESLFLIRLKAQVDDMRQLIRYHRKRQESSMTIPPIRRAYNRRCSLQLHELTDSEDESHENPNVRTIIGRMANHATTLGTQQGLMHDIDPDELDVSFSSPLQRNVSRAMTQKFSNL